MPQAFFSFYKICFSYCVYCSCIAKNNNQQRNFTVVDDNKFQRRLATCV